MADNIITFVCRLSRNLGASTSWNPKGLSRPVQGLLYLTNNCNNNNGHIKSKNHRMYIYVYILGVLF
jgi:hypothetical protein